MLSTNRDTRPLAVVTTEASAEARMKTILAERAKLIKEIKSALGDDEYISPRKRDLRQIPMLIALDIDTLSTTIGHLKLLQTQAKDLIGREIGPF